MDGTTQHSVDRNLFGKDSMDETAKQLSNKVILEHCTPLSRG